MFQTLLVTCPQLRIAVGTTACHHTNTLLQADIWPPCPSLPDLKTNTSDLAAGIQGIEGVLRAKQESHVKQFLLTEVALQTGHAAQQQIQALSADVQR